MFHFLKRWFFRKTAKDRIFTDHTVPEEVQKRRQELCKIWNDDKIYDCTFEAAHLVMFYKSVERASKKEHSDIGKFIVFWDREKKDLIHFSTYLNPEVIQTANLNIMQDGTLEIDDKIYDSPQSFVNYISIASNIVYKRLDIQLNGTLDRVLKQDFSNQCSLYFPPDHPILLVQIALANHDYKQAFKILKHPYIDDPNVERSQNHRLKKILEMILPQIMKGQDLDFFDYLIEEYDLLNPKILNDHTLPLSAAIESGTEITVQHVLKQYSPKEKSTIFEQGLFQTSKLGTPSLLDKFLENVPSKYKSTTINYPIFLSNIIERFGIDQFRKTTEKFNMPIPWKELIVDLSAKPVDPLTYLKEYKNSGGSLEGFDENVKNSLLWQALNAPQPFMSAALIIQDFPELKSAVEKTLNKAIVDENKIKVLLELGAIPTEDNFEELLKSCEIGPQRNHLFYILLDNIKDISQAKKSLKIASAFGEEALDKVMKKFPELEQDSKFLMSMLDQTWKGTKLALNKLLIDAVSVGKLPIQPIEGSENKKSQIQPEIYEMESGGKAVTIDLLIDILLPSGQFEQIKDTLLKRSDLIREFWDKCIFAGIANVEENQWQELASSTFPLITAQDRFSLIYDAIHYDHAPLASLFMDHSEKIPDEECIALFWTTLDCRNPDIANVLIDHGYLNTVNRNNTSYLHIAASENCPEFVKLLIERGANADLKDVNNNTPYNIAILESKLTIARMLGGEDTFKEFAHALVNIPVPSLESILYKAFLNSSGKDVLDLIAILHERSQELDEEKRKALIEVLEKAENFIRHQGTLIVRFPRKQTQLEVYQVYGLKFPNYETQQIEWGNICEEHYMEFYNESQNKDFVMLEVLMKFASPRTKEKGYDDWRMGYPDQGVGLVTNLGGRYFFFWGLAQKIYKTILTNPEWYKGELQKTIEGYRVFCKLPNGSFIPLTTLHIRKPFSKGVYAAKWIHTGTLELKVFLPYLAQLYDEIVRYPKTDKKEIPEDLKKKIAMFFWLGCHFTVTARGSSQYMVMIHRLLYNMHGFQTSPWSQRYVQPDCVALMMPFDMFYNEYYDDLFDYPFQRVKHMP